MTTIYKFRWNLPDIEVAANSLKEARKKAAEAQDFYAGSNDGSELLANAHLTENGEYTCDHPNPKTETYTASRFKPGGKWEKVKITYTSCRTCRQTLSETEQVL